VVSVTTTLTLRHYALSPASAHVMLLQWVIVSFENLLSEAEAAPIRGWDFSWLTGRSSEDRPSWHYMELAADRIRHASSALDLQTGVASR